MPQKKASKPRGKVDVDTLIYIGFFVVLLVVVMMIIYILHGKLNATSGGIPWA